MDNGDNLVQRGLATDVSQYKLELDHRRPACRIQGASGTVYVASSMRAEPDTWYQARCRRIARRVVLVVTDLRSGRQTKDTNTGRTGSLTPASPQVPVSVGGKLASDGSLVDSATDQLNGVVDEVLLRIG